MRSLSLAELQAMSRSMFLYITFITYHFSLFTSEALRISFGVSENDG